jgi:glucose-1-phosphate thymidylyltransferase
MLPLGNRPILEYVVEEVVRNGIRDLVLVVTYRKESIMTHFGDGDRFGARIQYVDQGAPLGTGHALLMARDALVEDEEFMVLAGDNHTSKSGIAQLLKVEGPGVLITESDIPARYGVVTVDGDRLTSVVEKPAEAIGNLISTGVYKLTPDILEVLQRCVDEGATDLSTTIAEWVAEGAELKVRSTQDWLDVVHPWDLLSITADVLAATEPTMAGRLGQNVSLKGRVSIGEDTVVGPGTVLTGPVLLGTGCEVGPLTVIGSSTSIGNNVSIGAHTYLHRTVVMEGAQIGTGSHIIDSVVGPGVKLGPHTVVASGPSDMKLMDGYTSLDPIGTMIGEDTQLAGNCLIEPGTLIGNRCQISAPRIGRLIPDGSKVM